MKNFYKICASFIIISSLTGCMNSLEEETLTLNNEKPRTIDYEQARQKSIEMFNYYNKSKETTVLFDEPGTTLSNEEQFLMATDYLLADGNYYDLDVTRLESFMEEINYDNNPVTVIDHLNSNGYISNIEKLTLNNFLIESESCGTLDDLRSLITQYRNNIYSGLYTTQEIEHLDVYLTSVELQIDLSSDYDQMGYSSSGVALNKINPRSAVMCGFAVAGWGVAAAALVTTSVATAGLTGMLLAGVGYSLATASLAGCFM
jgi:hypothetical protein